MESHLRIDGPISNLPELIKNLKNISSTFIIGHELKKVSKEPHFHVHLEHKIARDNVRKKFRIYYPKSKQMGLYVSHIKKTTQKNITYCIKNKMVHNENISLDLINIAKKEIIKFNREKGMTLIQKCAKHIYDVNEQIPGTTKSYLLSKYEIVLQTLKWFKKEKLSYPAKAWLHKFYVHLLMENGLEEAAVHEYMHVPFHDTKNI